MRITVNKEQKAIYDILLESSFEPLVTELENHGINKRKLCIVSDSNVANLYLREVKELLAPVCSKVISFVFPAGEENKNLDTVRELYKLLIVNEFDRQDLLIALGGGVVGDLSGYAAATYLRGIEFIQVPTTLLSQVDSSIGGKTGVDFDSYKNMVGAFHQPKLVYMNLCTLKSLPKEQYFSGMGEIIKHGLIKDASYYRWLKEHLPEISARDLGVCREMIFKSCHTKRQVVENDPLEKGERALLNFGHTIGHAVEKSMDFQLYHGECVAIGIVGAAYLSYSRGYLTKDELEDVKNTLQRFHLPVSIKGLELVDIVETMKHDKKMDSGRIRFILLKTIGCAYIEKNVTQKELEAAVASIQK